MPPSRRRLGRRANDPAQFLLRLRQDQGHSQYRRLDNYFHPLEKAAQLHRELRLNDSRYTVRWMSKLQTSGMQKVPLKIGPIVLGTIEGIADYGMTTSGEMDPNLMRDAGFHRDLE